MTGRRRLVLAVLVVLTVTLAVVDVTDDDAPGSPVTRLRAGAASVIGPAQEGADALGRAGSAAWSELDGSGAGELERLRRENAELAAGLAGAGRAEDPAEDLAATTSGRTTVTGRVVAVRGDAGGAWTSTLDVGADDGVGEETTVLAAGGLVGRVRAVAASTSEVLLLPDPRSGVGVRLEPSGQLGTARGTGEPGRLTLTLLDPQAQVATGEQVLTLGSDGDRPFVPGVLLGAVDSVLGEPGAITREATLRLAVDPTRLDLVAVLLP